MVDHFPYLKTIFNMDTVDDVGEPQIQMLDMLRNSVIERTNIICACLNRNEISNSIFDTWYFAVWMVMHSRGQFDQV